MRNLRVKLLQWFLTVLGVLLMLSAEGTFLDDVAEAPLNLIALATANLTVPDIVKFANNTAHMHVEAMKTVEAPKQFLPSNVVLGKMSAESRSQRDRFWNSMFVLTIISIIIAGTAIMSSSKCRKRMRRGHVVPITDIADSDEEEGVRGRGFSIGQLQALTLASFSINFAVDIYWTLHSIWNNQLSSSFGLDWEVYYWLFCMNSTWMLTQAAIAVHRLPIHEDFGLSTFLASLVPGTFPIVSDAYDTLKDVMFGGLCLQSSSPLLHGLGCLSWAYLFGIHLFILKCAGPEACNELAGSYLAPLLAEPSSDAKQEEDIEQRVCLIGPLQDTLLLQLYKQTTPPKQQLLLLENGFQSTGAIIYLIIENRVSPMVLALNIGVPLAQLVFAKTAHYPLKKRMGPWLLARLTKAVENGDLGKRDALIQTLVSDGCMLLSEEALQILTDKDDMSVNLSFKKIQSIHALGPALENNTSLRGLYLCENNIESIDALGPALEKNTSLRWLDLSANKIKSIDALGPALENNSSLLTLKLSKNNIERIDALGPALEKNSPLQLLHLSANNIESIDALGPALEKNNSLRSLALHFNKIKSIDALGPALEKNNSLESLSLDSNKIKSIDALGPALEKNSSLQELYLSANNIESIDALGPALEKNTSLRWLDLSENKIKSIDALGPAPEKTTWFGKINLKGNKIESN